MAAIKTLKDVKTQKQILPRTVSDAVIVGDQLEGGKSLTTALNEKQDLLQSGTNIKTINGQSLLGEGNIEVSGGGSATDVTWGNITGTLADQTDLQSALDTKADVTALDSLATKEELTSGLATKQNKLTAGENLSIDELTNTISFTNASGFRTEAQVQEAINDSLHNVGSISLQFVETLPEQGETNVIYLKPQEAAAARANVLAEGSTVCDQFIWNTGTSEFVTIGTTEVDLSQYATHEEVDDKIADAVGKITSFEVAIPESGTLPQPGVKGTIYLIPSETGDGFYDEYLWVNGKYTKIGTTSINFTDYVKKSELEAKGYQTVSDVNNLINTATANLATKEELAEKANTADVVSKTELSVTLEGYAKPEDITTAIETATGEGGNVATKAELEAKQDKLIAGANITIDAETNTISATGGGGGAATEINWGNIKGEITAQTDLQSALAAKANVADVYTREEVDSKVPHEIDIPIRTLPIQKNKVYPQETIFGWFGVSNLEELKELATSERDLYLTFLWQMAGSDTQYYTYPVSYLSVGTDNNTVKLAFVGLDPSNDKTSTQWIEIHLDGTPIDDTATGNTRVSILNLEAAFESFTWGNIEGNIDNQTDLVQRLNNKQDALTPGEGISIEGGVISCTATPPEEIPFSNITGAPTDNANLTSYLEDHYLKTEEYSRNLSDYNNDTNFVDQEYLTTYATKAYVDEKNYVDSSTLSTTLSNYRTAQQQEVIDDTKADKTSVYTKDEVYTKAETEQAITEKGYVTNNQVDSKLNNYVTTTTLEGKGYITNAALAGYATEAFVTEKGYQNATQVNTLIDNKLNPAMETKQDKLVAGASLQISDNIIDVKQSVLDAKANVANVYTKQEVNDAIQNGTSNSVKYTADNNIETKNHVVVPFGSGFFGSSPDNGWTNLAAVKGYNLETAEEIIQSEIGSATLHTAINSKDRPSIDTADGQFKLAYEEEVALKADADSVYTKDEVDEKLRHYVDVPIRTGLNKVYTNEEIFGWFHVEDLAALKTLAANTNLLWVRYGISLSTEQYRYRFPLEYLEVGNDHIKLIFEGLDSRDDTVSKYTININLNEVPFEESTANIKVEITSLETPALTGGTNITIGEGNTINAPTNVSAFTNDSGYQNASQVSSAIASAVADITGFEYQVVEELPPTGEKGIIYLILDNHGEKDVYDEYIWIMVEDVGSFEKIGNTDIDLSGYVLTSDLVQMNDEEIEAVWNAVFAA